MKRLALAALSVAMGFGQSNDCDTLERCQELLNANRNNSLASFRVGEIFLRDGNYQSALNMFRSALDGNLEPHWVEVWAHIDMGKIYDLTGRGGQRDRAVNEYRIAMRTKDNTRGALDEAAKYIEVPYKRN
jgi:tetratricopeptide (TPR) repeat protein